MAGRLSSRTKGQKAFKEPAFKNKDDNTKAARPHKTKISRSTREGEEVKIGEAGPTEGPVLGEGFNGRGPFSGEADRFRQGLSSSARDPGGGDAHDPGGCFLLTVTFCVVVVVV